VSRNERGIHIDQNFNTQESADEQKAAVDLEFL
jgi:hypothetical protein